MLTAGGITIPTFREPVQNPWTFAITGTSVVGFTTGSILSSTPRIGTFGTNNEVYVTGVNTFTSVINCFAWATGPNSAPPLAGLINAIYPTGELTIPNPIISGITSIGGSAWTFTISNIRGTLNYSTGTIFTATSIIGSFSTGSTVAVIRIDSFTQITAYASSGTTPVAGSIGIPVLSQSTATLPSGTPVSAVSTVTVLATRSKNIGGPTDSYKTSVAINRMPYPESIGIDRRDTLVIVDTINTATTKVRIFANQRTNTYGSGSKSTTDSLTGSTDFYVAGTGTGTISSGTTITRYWI